MALLVSRLWKHLTSTKAIGRRAFPADTLKAIQAAIAQGEERHRAEIRIVIEPSLSLFDVMQGQTARQRARELFSLYRVWDTEENCGVLIYINLADHKVEIVADRGVNRALQPNDWLGVCKTMTKGFAQGDYHDSSLAALEQLNALLQQQFPSNGRNANELSNRPLMI